MRIAVPYEDGHIFQHFGRTQQFKIYDTDGSTVLHAEVMSTDGVMHEALAVVLAGNGVDVLVCGGLGAGAMSALQEAGILVVSGASGDADTAVAAFLDGSLRSEGVNCNHDEDNAEEYRGCSDDCEGGCCGGRGNIASCDCGGDSWGAAAAATMNPAAAAMTAKAAAAAAADTMSRTSTALTSAKQSASTTKVHWMMALVLTPRMRETSPCLSSAEAAE